MAVSSVKEKSYTESKGFLRELPLLDYTASLYSEVCLDTTYLICAQHLASTTYSLFYALMRLGLKARNLSVIGKCYSSDPKTYEEVRRIGIDVCHSSMNFDSHRSFDEQYRENIQEFITQRKSKLLCNDYKTIIVLDDGGELILALRSFFQNEKHVIGIEQTSSGFRKLANNHIGFPVINVARSSAKLIYESPIIARLVLETLVKHLKQLPICPKKILIIGNGPIGSQIYENLNSLYQTSLYDIDPSRTTIENKHFECSLNQFDIIIGCTGSSALQLHQFQYLKKNVVLISASSSDREFDAVALRRKLPLIKDCHENLWIDGVHLFNCGFPINFSSDYREIDSDDLQLTRSLLLAAVLQAQSQHNERAEGFVPLNQETQRNILQKYQSMFGKKEGIPQGNI